MPGPSPDPVHAHGELSAVYPMTRARSHTVANLLLGAAGAVAGYYVLKNPALRRAALRVLKIGLTTTVPGYLIKETTSAWRETGRRAA
jgi:hypothetical protein